jgi:glycogen debranching enzyme
LYASSSPLNASDPGRFHCLFGRDSLVSALQLLPARPEIARATLRALAARQGQTEDPVTAEEEGKIGHEFRSAASEPFIEAGWSRTGELRYFGTTDATPWFLIVLAALNDGALKSELDGGWRGAAGWLARQLDGGDGFVRHPHPAVRGGLLQQGWRDAFEPAAPHGPGIVYPDGRVPAPGLADADTQAVAYAALRALAKLDPQGDWEQREHTLKARISAAFGPDVMAIEIDGNSVPGAGSQLGWLLWADALEPDASKLAAERLCQPDILTAHGLRTLSDRSDAFDPQAYHRGSVWPFDCWLGWGGLRAVGRETEAERVRTGVLAALSQLGDAPELYAVTRDGEPQTIARGNRRQAWTAGARWALAHSWDGRVIA